MPVTNSLTLLVKMLSMFSQLFYKQISVPEWGSFSLVTNSCTVLETLDARLSIYQFSFKSSFKVYVYMCVSMCECSAYGGQKGNADAQELELETVVSRCGCCGQNSGPLEEQHVLQTEEPSLQCS